MGRRPVESLATGVSISTGVGCDSPPGTGIAGYVVLSEGVVYRVEVDGGANVDFRVRRRPSLPPLLMVPLSREAAPGQSYLIVPRASEEYRIDVTVLGDEPVRLRIWTDPKEGSRWARIHAEGFRLPILAAGVQAVYIATFRDATSSKFDSAFGYHTAPQSATGFEGCLAVLPTGRILPDRVGGCALTFGLWSRGSGRNFYTLGIAPEYVVRRTADGAFSVSPQLAFGSTTGGKPTAQYTFIGLGGRYAASLAALPALAYQVEIVVLDIRSLPASYDSRRVSSITLRVGAGLALKL